MDFKIDTKDSFAIITPLASKLDANLAETLIGKCAETRLNGSNNLIISLQDVTDADASAFGPLVALHEESYSNGQSLVFTEIQAGVWATLKENETDLLLNIAPKMAEAVDIISMEILERDLFGEE
jgi:anti-anti-sigma regulatory factor